MIKFQNDYKVGIAVIDAQHESFFDILNKLELALVKKDLRSLHTLLEELIKYTKYHFITEEIFLAELDPEINNTHKLLHTTIQNDFFNFKERISTSDNPLPIYAELFDTSKTYLIEHVSKEDCIIKQINKTYF